MASYLPAPKEVRDLFGELLDRDVQISPSTPLAPTAKTPCTVGVYVDDSLQVTAVVCFDLAFSAHAAAAIGLVPVAGAEAAIAAESLDDNLRANVYEVLNIAASLFNADGATHVRLYDVHHVGEVLPGDVLVKALTLGRREDLAVEVAGYGAGRLGIVLVA